jgi:hypothetical protein
LAVPGILVLAGCAGGSPAPSATTAGSPADSPAASASAGPSSSSTLAPVYYVFTWEPVEGSPGCGPQGVFLKIVGDDVFEVTADGCDLSADRGTLEPGGIALRGVTAPCVEGEWETIPSTVQIAGDAEDLQIPGMTRVVGPTESIDDLNMWFSEENERVPYPVPSNPQQVTEWMDQAAEEGWISSGC